MGRQSAKSPVVIDLVDSDSDIEIIHHTIVVLDDEAPPQPTTRQVCTLRTRSIRGQALTATKRGIQSRPPLPAVKVEGTTLPTVKPEASPTPVDTGSNQRTGLNPSFRQGITGHDESDSDITSEVDEQYSHAKV